MKIRQHALDALEKLDGEEMILTLADKDVLDEGEGVELEAVREAEVRRGELGRMRAGQGKDGKKKRGLWDEQEEGGGLLAKYDEEEEMAFVIGDGGSGGSGGGLGGGTTVKAGNSLGRQQPAAAGDLKSRLEQAKMSVLAPLKSIGGDYYTAEEMEGKGGKGGKRKKKDKEEKKSSRRKKSLKKTKALTEEDIAEMEERALEGQGNGNAGVGNEGNMGSREERAARATRKQEMEVAAQEAKRGKFEAALEKANVKSVGLRADRPGEAAAKEEDLDEEEDMALAASMAKARAVALKRQAANQAQGGSVDDVAKQAIARRVKREEAEKGGAGLEEGVLTFTDVGEFVARSGVGLKAEDGEDGMDVDVKEEDVKEEDGGVKKNPRRRTYRRHGGGEDAGGFGKATDVEMEMEMEDGERGEDEDTKVKESRGGNAIVGTAADNSGKLGPGLGSVLSLLKDRGELNKSVEWGGRANDSRNSFFTNSMGGYKDVFTGGRTDNDLAANVEAALTRKDEFGRTMTPKEAFRQFCHSFHGIQPSNNSKEKRIKQAKRELDQKRKDSGATGERKLEKLQNASKTPFISLDGRKVKPGQQR